MSTMSSAKHPNVRLGPQAPSSQALGLEARGHGARRLIQCVSLLCPHGGGGARGSPLRFVYKGADPFTRAPPSAVIILRSPSS